MKNLQPMVTTTAEDNALLLHEQEQWGIKTHAIYAYTKDNTERSIAIYESLEDELTSLYTYKEGISKINILRATYPELLFELRSIGD